MTGTRRQLLLATPLALAGCGTILATQPYTPTTDWPLAPPPAGLPPGRRSRLVVQVHGIEAGPALADRGLITRLADGSIHRGYYNRWAAAPADATTAALIAWLQASGDFAAVVGDGASLQPDLTVAGTLDTLLADPSQGLARAALTLVVAKPVGIAERPVVQQRLVATAPLAGKDVAALVAAQRAALAGVLREAVALVAGGRR